MCQKVEIGLATLMKFAVVMETSTKDRDTIDKLKFLQKVNEQLLNVSAPYSESSYQNLKKLMGVASSFLPPPLYA